MRTWRSWRAQLAAILLIVLASGVALAIHLEKPARRMAAASPSGTVSAPLPPFPDCTKPNMPIESFPYVTQQADGGFSGCVRVDQAKPASYPVIAQGSPSKCCAFSGAASREALSVSPPTGPPGTMVTIMGIANHSPARPQTSGGLQLDEHTQVCWVACNVLSYSPVIHWSSSSPGQFEISFLVPSVPWMTTSSIQLPLPGRYPIVLPCIPDSYNQAKGCNTEQLTGSFQMTGPVPSLCGAGQPCSAIEVSPTQGPPGSVVAVRGWAPLVGLGGQANVYLRVHTGNTAWDSMPTLASTSFRVTAQPDWASLGTLHPLSILRSGFDAFGVDPANPHRIAYCSGSAIQVTGDSGQSWASIPIQGAVVASAPTRYPLGTRYQANPVSCEAVALDPAHPASFYASFLTVDRNGAPPPFNYVGYFTTDAGRTWHPVPVPAGSDMGAFGGFQVDLSGVRALYAMWSDSLPPDQPMVAVEATVDGGNTWTKGNLACPQAGPCVALGSKGWARCMAVEGWEAVLVSTDNSKSWSTTNHIGSCWRVVEVVGLADGRLVTLDGSSQFPLTISDDGDRTARTVALPQLPNPSDTGPAFGSLELLPDGRLLSVSLHWSLLAPGASAWCTVAGGPTGNQTSESNRAPQLIGDHFWWLEGMPATLHSFPLSALHC